MQAHLEGEEARMRDSKYLSNTPPASTIPATGRGNSDDGKHWMNPSSGELYRAMQRNNKGLAPSDAFSVANVHEAVTSETWDQVMEVERTYFSDVCATPKLARFQGMFGIPTLTSRWTEYMTGLVPFDRHDWVCDEVVALC